MSEALSIRLREVLREDMGGTYTIGVDGDLIRWPASFARANVNFTCAPDNVGKLSDAVAAEILAARTKGFEPSYLDKVKAAQRRSLEEAVRTNGYWLGWLTEHYRAGTDPRQVLQERKLIETLDVAALQAAARRYFDDKQKMVGVLKPLSPSSARLMLPRDCESSRCRANAGTRGLTMKDVVALILGGGRGTRLFPLTQHRSKPAVPIGGNYRLIDVAVSNCLHADVRRIFVLTQYQSESLNSHIGEHLQVRHVLVGLRRGAGRRADRGAAATGSRGPPTPSASA